MLSASTARTERRTQNTFYGTPAPALPACQSSRGPPALAPSGTGEPGPPSETVRDASSVSVPRRPVVARTSVRPPSYPMTLHASVPVMPSTLSSPPPLVRKMHAYRRPLATPRASLVIVFAAWKTLLLLMAFASPGPGYDTSTTLLLGRDAAASAQVTASVPWTPTIGERLASKLTRWDAIYFSVAAERGYHYEQEWAFSWALNRFIARVVRCMSANPPTISLSSTS